MKKMSILGICIIALVALATWVPNAFGYTTYRDDPGFIGGPPSGTLHGAHTAYITGCTPCHQTIGSIPVETGNSNNDQGPGCTGCHQADGLQEHHTNEGAPADGSGLTCANCHPNRTPLPENDAPPYYGTAITSIVDPCSSQPPPGEDASGDNFGLDNDGDLIYDESDPDCAVPECTVDGDCDDGVFCNGAETCVAGTCVTGTPPSCDDGVGCTVPKPVMQHSIARQVRRWIATMGTFAQPTVVMQ
jgi:hypothetical protein